MVIFWSIVLLIVAAAVVVNGLALLQYKQIGRSLSRFFTAALVAGVGLVFLILGLAAIGYHNLTDASVAATVTIEPVSPERFKAHLNGPAIEDTTLLFTGDQFYVDAYVLTWKPWVSLLGFKTQYTLNRAAGRYRDIEKARREKPVLYELHTPGMLDLVSFSNAFAPTAFFYNARYGSGVFVPATKPATWLISVTSSGLAAKLQSKHF